MAGMKMRQMLRTRVLAVAGLVVLSVAAPVPSLAADGTPVVDGAGVAPAISTCPAIDSCATITILSNGDGSGETYTDTAGPKDGLIDCVYTYGTPSGSCSYEFSWLKSSGTLTVHLDSAPAMGSYLCYPSTGQCLQEGYSSPEQFVLSNGDARTFAIGYRRASRILSVSIQGDGTASVTSTNIEGIDCPATACAFAFAYDETVHLHIKVAAGSIAGAISGACEGQVIPDCTVTMTDNVSTVFEVQRFTLVTPSPRPSRSVPPGSTGDPSSGAPVASGTGPADSGLTVPGSTEPGQSGTTAPGPSVGASQASAPGQASEAASIGVGVVIPAIGGAVVALLLVGFAWRVLRRRPPAA
ncbi:MAG: hypothetical protein HY263_07680 [Chloroflexi bacterium]|nr:hypothetical protein [Chloroflexota bacterium]